MQDSEHKLVIGKADSYGNYKDAACTCGLKIPASRADSRKGVASWYSRHYDLVCEGRGYRALNRNATIDYRSTHDKEWGSTPGRRNA